MDLLEALNVRVVGSGERTLVLGHGVGSDQSSWRSVVPFFRRDHRIVLYDLPFAGTIHPNHFDAGRYATLDAYVDDLLSILDTLGIHRCTYVGHSISASIGIIASINRPHLFTKLILLGFSPRFLNDHDYHGGYERADIEQAFSAMQANYEAWVHGHAPRAVGADASAEAVGEFRRTQLQMRPDITVFVLRMALYMDLRGMLERVTVPCSVIQTAEDVAVPTAVAIYVANHLRQSTLHMLNTRGHLPHLSAPNLLVPELRRALPPTE